MGITSGIKVATGGVDYFHYACGLALGIAPTLIMLDPVDPLGLPLPLHVIVGVGVRVASLIVVVIGMLVGLATVGGVLPLPLPLLQLEHLGKPFYYALLAHTTHMSLVCLYMLI